jgi:hypothetical protein
MCLATLGRPDSRPLRQRKAGATGPACWQLDSGRFHGQKASAAAERYSRQLSAAGNPRAGTDAGQMFEGGYLLQSSHRERFAEDNTMTPSAIRPAALLFAALLCCGGAAAAVRGQTRGGVSFIEGGIGVEDAQILAAERGRHPLTIRTAARRSGAYLADVHMTIRDAAGIAVFERQLEAPWLMIDLPPGRYRIAGVRDGQVELLSITVPAHGYREAVMYFGIAGETVPHGADEATEP